MQHILEQFPNWCFEIDLLYLENTDFRELCQDYEEVRALVASWNDSYEIGQATIDEYQTLLKDLETEIMEDLEARFGTAVLPNQNTSSHAHGFGYNDDTETLVIVAILLAIVMAINLVVLLTESTILKYIGPDIINVSERILGLLLAALAVQTMLNALQELGLIVIKTGAH